MNQPHQSNHDRQLPWLLGMLLLLSILLGYGARTRLPWSGEVTPPASTMTQAGSTTDWGKVQLINDYIRDFYNGPIVETSLIDGALKGMVASLDDGGGQYFNAREYAEILARPGMTRGTGIQLGTQDDRIIVLRVDENSQGEKEGILPGDLLLKINGRAYAAGEIEAARNLMLSQDRRSVTLELLRGAELIRTEVRLRLLTEQPIRSMVRDNVGIIRLPGFPPVINQAFRQWVTALRQNGARALILDLRDLSGGQITEAVNLAAHFIPSGETVTTIRDTRGNLRQFISQDGAHQDLSLIVLINERTQGTGEFVAGALRQKADAHLVGEITAGEGRVFSYLNLPEGEGIKLITGNFLLPDGGPIQDTGIEPDETVTGTPLITNNLIQPGDAQMRWALKIARGRLDP